jgi:hypothetical protein
MDRFIVTVKFGLGGGNIVCESADELWSGVTNALRLSPIGEATVRRVEPVSKNDERLRELGALDSGRE